MRYKFIGSSNKGVGEWFLQRATGVIITIVIFIHYFAMSKGNDIGLDKIISGPLLIFGLFHTFNGFKMILDDYVKKTGWRLFWLGVFVILGVILAIVGLNIISG